MKKLTSCLLLFFNIFVFNITTFCQKELSPWIVVTKDNFTNNGWEKSHSSNNISTENSQYVSIGLSIDNILFPKLQRGAAYLERSKEVDPDLQQVRLRNNSFGGVLITDIIELKYCTYTEEFNNIPTGNPPMINKVVAPVMILQLDLDTNGIFDTKFDNSINFWPDLQNEEDPGLQKVEKDVWQLWDGLTGYWKFGAGGMIPDWGINNEPFTLATFKEKYSGKAVKIINNNGGGVRFTLTPEPRFNEYKGYVDAIIIRTNSFGRSYDFKFTKFPIAKWILYAVFFGLVIWGCFRIVGYYKTKQQRVSRK
jgi:hypothetical protein